jgi:RNA polymerase sigma-70 factor (ECF subfamily)
MDEKKIIPVEPITPEELGAAFTTLRTRLGNYLCRRVSDQALAEDLIQEVFAKAAAVIGSDRAPGNLTGWLYAAVRTTLADHYRSVRSDNVELDDNLPDRQYSNADYPQQELATCLRPLVQQLPSIYRDTLLATDFEGKKMRALAQEQNVSLSAIKSRASRARRMLKEKLLGCCHVEISNGTVTDYHSRSPNSCEDSCV